MPVEINGTEYVFNVVDSDGETLLPHDAAKGDGTVLSTHTTPEGNTHTLAPDASETGQLTWDATTGDGEGEYFATLSCPDDSEGLTVFVDDSPANESVTLDPGETATITFYWGPDSTGTYTATVSGTDDSDDSSVTVE